MKLRARLSAIVGMSMVMGGFVLALPGATLATSCGTHGFGTSWNEYSNTVTAQLLKQADAYENFSGSTATATFQVSQTVSETDSVSSNVSVDASIKAGIFGGFETKMSAEMGYVGQVTAFGSVTYSTPLANGDTYIFYTGTKHYSGSWVRYTCSTSGLGRFTVASGTVNGYMLRVQGVVACKSSPGSSTLAYVAKVRYC